MSSGGLGLGRITAAGVLRGRLSDAAELAPNFVTVFGGAEYSLAPGTHTHAVSPERMARNTRARRQSRAHDREHTRTPSVQSAWAGTHTHAVSPERMGRSTRARPVQSYPVTIFSLLHNYPVTIFSLQLHSYPVTIFSLRLHSYPVTIVSLRFYSYPVTIFSLRLYNYPVTIFLSQLSLNEKCKSFHDLFIFKNTYFGHTFT